MALREVRIYVRTGDRHLDGEITRAIYHPFSFYMDTLMRGQFKEYSGEDVKGLSLVNLRLYSQEFIANVEAEGHIGQFRFDIWVPMLNTLQLESVIDVNEIKGSRKEKVTWGIEIFLKHAEKSDLPQMKKLAKHLKEAQGIQHIEDAIKKADEYIEKLHAK